MLGGALGAPMLGWVEWLGATLLSSVVGGGDATGRPVCFGDRLGAGDVLLLLRLGAALTAVGAVVVVSLGSLVGGGDVIGMSTCFKGRLGAGDLLLLVRRLGAALETVGVVVGGVVMGRSACFGEPLGAGDRRLGAALSVVGVLLPSVVDGGDVATGLMVALGAFDFLLVLLPAPPPAFPPFGAAGELLLFIPLLFVSLPLLLLLLDLLSLFNIKSSSLPAPLLVLLDPFPLAILRPLKMFPHSRSAPVFDRRLAYPPYSSSFPTSDWTETTGCICPATRRRLLATASIWVKQHIINMDTSNDATTTIKRGDAILVQRGGRDAVTFDDHPPLPSS
jgi:hypothetical protein